MKNNFMKSENFTKWAIRKVSVGVVSAAIASGIFVIVGGGEAHASDLQDKAPVVQNVDNKQTDTVVESKAPENKTNTVEKVTTPVEKQTVEVKNDVTAEKQPSVKSEPSVNAKEVDANNLLKLAKDVAEPQTTPVEVKKAVMDNTKDIIDVPAKYLDKANFPGPFTAGVNQVIPYEFFGGDGMLTRLILKSSDKAPWSDNGLAKNPALLPLEKLGKGLYFYEVDLEGTKGKSDKELLDLLKANGTQSYKATIKVYGEKDGKADLTNVVATKDVNVNLNLNGLTTVNEVKKAVMDNTKDTIDVPAKYLDKANFPGPFTAGVNQVIPYHLFAGDGMLTRLILKASDKAPWSDNGSAKNPALPPVEKLGHGLYFYEVDLAGTQGKSDKELLDLLKANGTRSYKATIKVYGEKDGKADLTNLVATKEVTVNLHKEAMEMEKKPGENMMMDHKKHGLMDSNMSGKTMDMHKSDDMTMKAHMDKDMKAKNMNAHMNNDMMKKGMLPKTSAAPEGTMNATNSTNSSTTGIVGLIIASLLGLLGLRRKNEID